MHKKLNWKSKKFLSKNKPFVLFATLCFVIFLFVQAAPKQNEAIVSKTKSILVDGTKKAFISLQGVGSSFPCGEEMGIALEDTGRYIFSAQSGWLATILPSDAEHTLPPPGFGPGKLEDKNAMTYQNAYDRTKDLAIGTFKGTHGKRWAITDEQASNFYKQVHSVNLAGQQHTAFDHNNMFYEGLITTQILVEKTEVQAALIEDLVKQNEVLTERLENIERELAINNSQFTIGEISINPNPSKNNIFVVEYNLFQPIKNASFIITDIQGRTLHKADIEQTKGNLQVDIHLSAGTYLCFLYNNSYKSIAKKLIIQ